MSGKSQSHTGKHSEHSKKSRAIERSKDPALHQPILTQISRPVVTPDVSSRKVAMAASKTVRYPFITAELKRIGILAGIILVILIVLALVLS